MANRLKKIFSNEKIIYNENIKFTSKKAYRDFLNALDTVHNEGKGVKIEGVASIETSVTSGESKYPIANHDNIVDVFVYPSIEEVSIDVETEFGKKILKFNRIITSKEIILETDDSAIVYLKMNVNKETEKTKISYKTNPNHASSVTEILEIYSAVFDFLNNSFIKNENENRNPHEFQIMVDTEKYFTESIEFYKKLFFVEKKFNICFLPSELFSDMESEKNLNEIFFLLHDRIAIRLNAEFSDFESKAILSEIMIDKLDIKERIVGSLVEIPFLRTIEYKLWNNKVNIYSSNLLSNAKIKEIEQVSRDEVKIYITNSDSCPMFISFKGFLKEEDAEKERDELMNTNREEYIKALTLSEYMKHNSKTKK